MQHARTGQPAMRSDAKLPAGGMAPSGIYPCKPGGPNDYVYLFTSHANPEHWRRLLRVIGREDLLDDPRFATNDRRVRNRAAINAAVEARLVSETTAYWIDKLNTAGVPCGRVMGLGEVFADPQVIDQQMVLSQDHPGHGTVQMLGVAEAPCELRRPAPEIGADTDAVLAELGYSAAEIAALRHAGVV